MRSDSAAFVVALGRLLLAVAGDARVSRRDKALALAGTAYLLSPVDLLPLGPLDDLAVATAALRRLLRSAGYDLLKEHWRGSDDAFVALLLLAGVER